jgi:hypothetical protein
LSPVAVFAAWFAATLAALVVVAWSGMRARRRVHIPAVVVTYVLLGTTIYCAYALGRVLDLRAAGPITPIHLSLARAATLALVVASAFGVRTLFVPAARRWHRRIVWFALTLVVLAAGTGVAMVALAPPR